MYVGRQERVDLRPAWRARGATADRVPPRLTQRTAASAGRYGSSRWTTACGWWCARTAAGPDRGGEPLVQRRLAARARRQARLRAPLRAPDVPGLRAGRQDRAFQCAAGGRRQRDQRDDERGPDELLPDGAERGAADGAVARGGPDGQPRADPGEPGQPARGRQERASAAVRQRALRPLGRDPARARVPGGPPVPPLDDRLDGRAGQRRAVRLHGLLRVLLLPGQRGADHRGRRGRGAGAPTRRGVLRRSRPGPARNPKPSRRCRPRSRARCTR